MTVVATRTNPLDWFGMSFVATDVDGNQVTCDPVVADLLREGESPDTQSWSDLSEDESIVTITNDVANGVQSVTLVVKRTTFRMSGFADGEVRTVDIASAMLPGSVNTISAIRPGATARIMISNSRRRSSATLEGPSPRGWRAYDRRLAAAAVTLGLEVSRPA